MTKTAWLYACATILAGLAIAASLPLEWEPSLSAPTARLRAVWPGTSPLSMAKVGSRIESSLLATVGARRVRSVASRGIWTAEIQLSPQIQTALQRAAILDRIAALRDDLPPGLTLDLETGDSDNPSSEALMTLQLALSNEPTDALQQADRVAGRLRSVPGVAQVQIRGLESRELRATLKKIHTLGCRNCASLVREQLRDALSHRVFGTLEVGIDRRPALRAALANPSELPNLATPWDESKPLSRLGDLADIGWAKAPKQSFSRIDGQDMATLTVHHKPGSDILKVAAAIHRQLADLRYEIAALDLRVADDRSEQTRKQLQDLARRASLGLILIALVLRVSLRSSAAAGLCLFSVLLSFSVSFFGFHPLKLTLNAVTLAGLALLLGLLVDNSVIMVERLQLKSSSRGSDAKQDLWWATRETALPLVAATLSTCVALLPLIYLSGELKQLFAPFAVLSVSVLIISLLVSLGVVPVLARGVQIDHQIGRAMARRASTSDRARSRLQTLMIWPCRLASQYPKSSLALLLLAIGLPMSELPNRIEEPSHNRHFAHADRLIELYNRSLGSAPAQWLRPWIDPLLGGVTDPFVRKVDFGKRWNFPERPEIRVQLRLPNDSGIERVDQLIRPFESEAQKSAAVRRTLIQGIGQQANLTVLLHDQALSTEEPLRLRERLINRATGLAGVEVSVSGLLPKGFYSGLGQVSGFVVQA